MEKKNNGGLIAIIIILIIALLGVCFYVAYDKGLIFDSEEDNDVSEDSNNNEIECENYESLRIDGEEVSDITELIQMQGILSEGNNLLLTSEEVTYEKISDKYNNNSFVPPGTYGPQVMIHIVNAIKQDNKYTITLKAIFPGAYDNIQDSEYYYADYNRTIRLNDLYYDMNMGGNPPNTLNNLSKGSTYELIFTKIDDGYKFETSKPLNN